MPPIQQSTGSTASDDYISGKVTTALRRVERTLFDGLLTDELVQLLLFEIEQLVVADRHCVHELVLHVEIGYREHCMRTTQDTCQLSWTIRTCRGY